MTFRIFREPREGVVAHTAASRVLAETPLLQQWVGQTCEDMWPAATRVVDAMARWPGSEEPNEAGFNVANDSVDPAYVEIGKDEQRAERFADAMTFFHQRPGLDMKYLLEDHEWVSGRDRTLFVDVGGSHGPVSIALAEKFPSVHCIVQDLPEVIEKANAPPSAVASRVEFMAHNFFEPQPVCNADFYYFRWILHNWSDKYALRILRSLVPAMKHGARVIVNEFYVPPPGVLSLYRERDVRGYDMAMKELQNAKERDAGEWARLFETADPRFFMREIREPAGSDLAIIVAEWMAKDEVEEKQTA
ncbi:hypothetical protein GJ744_009431 [Endocarpon pusillum]|uniref:O-methyltransferase C-terminal domain-containing protein n=1 Tax=Endocarpon pusillum TaxID=364733 RepID=A0A8H7E672_9EURO|nr:hypothetical protein GJ744_009431 [Endocarpon pusillum]